MVAINSDTLEVSIFNSQVSAGHRLGISNKGICNVLNGWQKTTHGVWLCRADSNAVERVRAEFGDEVAEKVEELMNKSL